MCVVYIMYPLNKLQGMETLCPTQAKHAIELKQVIALSKPLIQGMETFCRTQAKHATELKQVIALTKPLILNPLILNCNTNLQSSQTCILSTSSGKSACVLSTGRQRAK